MAPRPKLNCVLLPLLRLVAMRMGHDQRGAVCRELVVAAIQSAVDAKAPRRTVAAVAAAALSAAVAALTGDSAAPATLPAEDAGCVAGTAESPSRASVRRAKRRRAAARSSQAAAVEEVALAAGPVRMEVDVQEPAASGGPAARSALGAIASASRSSLALEVPLAVAVAGRLSWEEADKVKKLLNGVHFGKAVVSEVGLHGKPAIGALANTRPGSRERGRSQPS